MQRIEGMVKSSPTARGFVSGRRMAFVVDPSLPYSG